NGVESLGPGRPDLLRRNQQLLDARTGRWFVDLGSQKILSVRVDAGLARLMDSSGSVCSFLPPPTADGKERPFWGEPRSYDPEPNGPRLAVGLPWAEGRKYGDIASASLVTLWPTIPVLLLVVAWRRHSWRWSIVALLALSLAVTAWLREWVPAKPQLSLTVST